MRSTDASKPANISRLLRETVYEQLRADMISCRLAPGTEIREAELAARFEVSKSPVRDALMRLEREGLVISLPRQGYRVAPVSLKDVQDMFHLRAALERACMERIVLYASDEQLEELNAFRHFNPSEWNGGFVVYNRAFHHRLAQLGTNIRMRDHLIDLIDQMERAVQISLSNINKGDPQSLVQEHSELIDALQARVVKRAQRLAEHHIAAAGKRVRNAISKIVIGV
ncbi:MAG TPA: GntR family transcriptional regulator [Polaromonas sp.]|uniref:GntR family transcriptional regulator n=1 Tax=Polaromonas sp. UBA4122 TaxID=1947074 RepID=UPI000EC271A3|nr:GntR family transcriptional regulator [Polaromonas sp. UBA4122]HAL36977.1 GntR family transcriptional regulator [Polaromonas sp.]